MLFEVFWLVRILQDIVIETNEYAIAMNMDKGTCRELHWKNCTLLELKVFMTIILNMA